MCNSLYDILKNMVFGLYFKKIYIIHICFDKYIKVLMKQRHVRLISLNWMKIWISKTLTIILKLLMMIDQTAHSLEPFHFARWAMFLWLSRLWVRKGKAIKKKNSFPFNDAKTVLQDRRKWTCILSVLCILHTFGMRKMCVAPDEHF